MPIINSNISDSSIDVGNGKYELTLWDLFGNPVKIIHLNKGDTYTLPQGPALDKCGFVRWACNVNTLLDENNVVTMPNYPIDCVPVYAPTSGYDEFDVHITNFLGHGISESTTKTITMAFPEGATVDWGDGSAIETIASVPVSHTYSAEGDYTITRTGGTDTYPSGVIFYGDSGAAVPNSSTNPNTWLRAIRLGAYANVSSDTNFGRYCFHLRYATGVPAKVYNPNSVCWYSGCSSGLLGAQDSTSSSTSLAIQVNYTKLNPFMYRINVPYNGAQASTFNSGNSLKHLTWLIPGSGSTAPAGIFGANLFTYSGGVMYFPRLIRGSFLSGSVSSVPVFKSIYVPSLVLEDAMNNSYFSDWPARGVIKAFEDETKITFTFAGIANLDTFKISVGTNSSAYSKTYTSSDITGGQLVVYHPVAGTDLKYTATKTDSTTVTDSVSVGVEDKEVLVDLT